MRNVICLNEGWRFIQKNAGLPECYPKDWMCVDLPHTWNAVDGQNGNGSYDKGTYWYARKFKTPKQPLSGGSVFLEFLGAAQQAEVYVNGQKAAYHEGGFSTFRVNITKLCREEEENLLVVSCSNEFKDSVYPQNADFTFYGGLYRGVNLISVPDTHFDLEYYGGPGMKVTPKLCENGKDALFEIEAWIKNPDENFTVLYSIIDENGEEAAYGVRPADCTKIVLLVPDVKKWSMDEPHLYTIKALLQRRNEAYDEITLKSGVRSFSCTPEQGFVLNGLPTPLRGVSRHQDMLYKGNALTKEDHYADAEMIKELGANTIRLAHYQHAQEFYDACDELGFAVWAEIPFISVFNETKEAHLNCISQMKELIIQNYHHPSIFFWGISNEILIGGISQQLVDNHIELNALCKKLDPTRLTTIAHVSHTPTEGAMHHLTDTEAYNHYFGWYGGNRMQNGPWLDEFHEKHPEICIGLSEYGAEGIITYHSSNPGVKDYSEEYQALYHEHLAQVLEERSWVWGSYVWNMFDFGCAARNEGGVSGRNNKGLVTIDRKTKKDSFYVYQAYWSKKPMVHICGKRYAQRLTGKTVIKIYSNQPSVTLYQDGEKLGTKNSYRVFEFEVNITKGFHIFCADTGMVKDTLTLEGVEKEPAIYVLPEVNERAEGVANWFKQSGKLDLTPELEFPQGRYNINHTLEELSHNEKAFQIAQDVIKITESATLTVGGGMWEMIKGEVLRTELENALAAELIPEGFLELVNAKLIQIEK